MAGQAVSLIGFHDMENLGLGYLSSMLSQSGFSVNVLDVRKPAEDILKTIQDKKPLLVGFSVIFERHIYEFCELSFFLRQKGVDCHFTAGGHFASLRTELLFEMFPTLDSIVRFEGEHSLLELVKNLHSGSGLRTIQGISFRSEEGIVHNGLRPLENDLDIFPYPDRDDVLPFFGLRKRYGTLLAGRGCVHQCSFCDIREFFGPPPGRVKRIRNPEKVVEEMEYLFHEKDCAVFLFQDDDFPVAGKQGGAWTGKFLEALENKNLCGKILWKINCRPDEIDQELFSHMKMHGLFKVYLGIEDGTDLGLKQMRKHLSASQNLNAVRILKDLEISVDYGFMLFQPSSTYRSIRKNLEFLKSICGDGYMPVSFLKMMPYMETRIERELRSEERLSGIPGFLDYTFLDRSLDDFYKYASTVLNGWLNEKEGLATISKWTRDFISMLGFFFEIREKAQSLRTELEFHLARANHFLIDTLTDLTYEFESGRYHSKENPMLRETSIAIEKFHWSKVKLVSGLAQQANLYSITSGLFSEKSARPI